MYLGCNIISGGMIGTYWVLRIVFSSTGNQRIESWWSQFRRSKSNWWIDYFNDMRVLLSFAVILDSSNIYHLEAIRFCYLSILEKELNEFVNV